MQVVRTKNVKEGERGKECEEKNPSAVKQHPTLMFHGIPGRVNSNACKNSKPAFLLLFVPGHFMNQVLTFFFLFFFFLGGTFSVTPQEACSMPFLVGGKKK